jgi:hypothetical protein
MDGFMLRLYFLLVVNLTPSGHGSAFSGWGGGKEGQKGPQHLPLFASPALSS